MRNLYKIIFFCSCGISYSQTPDDIAKIQSYTNVSKLQSLSIQYKTKAEQNKQKALDLAKINGWKTSFLNENGTSSQLMSVTPNGKHPIYIGPDNVNAAKSTRTNFLNTGGSLGLNLDGQNMTAYVWDVGAVLPTHVEFEGRVSIIDGVTTIGLLDNNSQHANHVTGTIVAAGKRAAAKGMASKANAKTSDYNNDLSEAATAAANGMLLSNHSYGYIIRNFLGIVEAEPWQFGPYEEIARDWDELMYNAPYYLMVRAAGNNGNDNTANSSPLGGNTHYDKLTDCSAAKNNLVVANANDATISSTGTLTSVTIHSSSSQGPTDDLRIKPDLAGNGVNVFSTATILPLIDLLTNISYGYATGTSMSAPNVTGTLLLLQQHYKNTTGNFMRAATLKGLALHTADDFGAVGPDAVAGWGLLNAKFAAETITKKGTNAIIEENTLESGDVYSFDVESDGVHPLIASLSWTDPAGVADIGPTPNIATPKLVNDLDIRVGNGSGIYFPYKLTSATTNALGDNLTDPFERINIDGAAGTYTILVTNKGTLINSNQNYSVIVTGITVPTEELKLAESSIFTIFPNPTNGVFKININSDGQGTLRITNIHNNVVFEEKNTKKRELDVNIAHEIPGIYIVQFISNKGITTTKKIIKK
jgi:hypothetical protein